jgi:prevent-host-death family protein
MTKTANMHEAKSQLSKLVDAALAGEEVIIQKAGKPAVRLVPIEAPKFVRKGGAWKGKVWIADDFNDTPQDIIDLFYESEIFPKERG